MNTPTPTPAAELSDAAIAHRANCQSRIDAILNRGPYHSCAQHPRTETKSPCPKCGCPSELNLDSSRIANASWIDCGNCGFRVQQACDEETLEGRWNKLSRKQMPVYVEPA